MDNFGTVIIPRIGMEVIVTYLEGNPDNPLVTGCFINRVTPPAYPLPENKTKTVLRTHSSPTTGGYNELSMDDRAGDELVHLRAQRDMEQKVGNDSRHEVGNESRVTIKGDRITVLGSEEHLTITSDRKIQVSGNDYLHVSGDSHTRSDETLVIEAGQHVHIKAGSSYGNDTSNVAKLCPKLHRTNFAEQAALQPRCRFSRAFYIVSRVSLGPAGAGSPSGSTQSVRATSGRENLGGGDY
ncbi:bacteriophage T4 gp5 trimerisation domain-containing protein [Pseudomonas hormoni]